MIKIGPASAPHILRWHILPRNRFFNVWLHKIIRDDPTKMLHNHPSWNISVRLWGRYIEEIPAIPEAWPKFPATCFRDIGRILFRRAELPHRIVLQNKNKPVWSLFICGNPSKPWGFYNGDCLISWRVMAIKWGRK